MSILSDGFTWVWNHPAQAALAVLGFGSSVAGFARLVIASYAKYTATTPDPNDDVEAARLLERADRIVAIADIVRRCMFRVVIGPFPSTQPIARLSARPGVPEAPRTLPMPAMKPLSVPPPVGELETYGTPTHGAVSGLNPPVVDLGVPRDRAITRRLRPKKPPESP
jgi:hypothetical protein